MTTHDYTTDDIEVLTMAGAIRKRPGMYLDLNLPPQERLRALLIQAIQGLFHMGVRPERVHVIIHDDHALTCTLRTSHVTSMNVERWIMTTPTMTFPNISPTSMLIAFSHHVTVSVHQPHNSWSRHYISGEGEDAPEGSSGTDFTGVRIDFRIDPSFFEDSALPSLPSMQTQLARFAYFQPDTIFSCHDRRSSDHMTFTQPEGLRAMLCAMTHEHDAFLLEPVYIECEALHCSLKVALQWTKTHGATLESRVSGDHVWTTLHTSQQGPHTDAVSQAMHHAIASHPQMSDPHPWHPVFVLDLHIALPYSPYQPWHDPLQLIYPEIAESITHTLTPLIEAHVIKAP